MFSLHIIDLEVNEPGFTVTGFETGQDAIDWIANSQYHPPRWRFIITDEAKIKTKEEAA